MALNSSSRRTIGQECVSTTRHFTAISGGNSGIPRFIPAGRCLVNGYDEISSIAQKSLAKCAPLMGELSELTPDPVRYW
jgi:hypothetical protein